MIQLSGFLVAAILGWIAGALANWAADTLPYRGAPDGCSSQRAFDLRHDCTLWWYPVRRGRCPHCGERRPLRPPLLEGAMSVAFMLEWYLYSEALPALPIAWGYTAFLLTVLVIDLEHRRVLNVMLRPAAIIALLISVLPGGPDPLNALLGGAAGFGLFLALAILQRGALGAGDVKLAGLIGLMTGYPGVLVALILGMILGGVGALLLLASRRAGRKSYMAYAPYLSLGTLVALIQVLAG